ncbi:MAG: hypothetical protein J5936_05135 [Acholeplasmatales bacterium]|nr:hypothetical protein [Acholeplasmatales bacterium]
MDLHCEMILEQYKQKKPLFIKVKDIALQELNKYVKEFGTIVNSVEGRVKEEKSLAGKLELKGYKYQSIDDITDIVGTRVVTFYNDEVDKFAAKIEQNFDVDWDNSIDKRKMHNIDQFGYMSLHYICRIPKELYYDPENPEINNVRFEIQLRSILQHAWAVVQHDTGYKTDVEIPKEYLRSLSRLSGLLELVDESFCQLRISIDDYRRRVKQVVKNGKFEDIELNGDSYSAYLDNGGFEALNKHIAAIQNMEIEDVSLKAFLRVFKSFGFTTLKQLDDFVKDYSDVAYEFAVRQFSGRDLDIITSAAGPLALCVVYVLSKDMGEKVVKMILDAVYGPRTMNERTAARLTKIGKSMGLINVGDDSEE